MKPTAVQMRAILTPREVCRQCTALDVRRFVLNCRKRRSVDASKIA